jgi:hypothetical protein
MRPLKFEIKNEVLIIEIGIDVLANCAQHVLDEEHYLATEGGEIESPSKVVDNVAFAKAIAKQLDKEEPEDGSTPMTRMLDAAIIEVFESGDESISCRDH